jgi:hypothetical protein
MVLAILPCSLGRELQQINYLLHVRRPEWPIDREPGSGDACVNDCFVHPLVQQLPFGGVGNSGMGKYHGHWGFERPGRAHSALIDPGVKYPPYSKHKLERKIMKELL